jgi:hypothetical protein
VLVRLFFYQNTDWVVDAFNVITHFDYECIEPMRAREGTVLMKVAAIGGGTRDLIQSSFYFYSRA